MTTVPLFLSGNANFALSEKIAKHCNQSLGKATISQFSDGETRVEILESVRGRAVYIIQSTSTPTNHHLMELLLMTDAVKRAGASRITAVMPYFGYARQEMSAKVVADLLAMVSMDQMITVDLHTMQCLDFFSIPVNNLTTTSLFLEDALLKKLDDPIVVSPDLGGVVRAEAFAKKLNHVELSVINKHQPYLNTIDNVKDRDCIIIDDIIDTGKTLCNAAKILKAQGAKSINAYITHPVLSGHAVKNITEASIDELVITDTIPLSVAGKTCSKIRVCSIASLVANALI